MTAPEVTPFAYYDVSAIAPALKMPRSDTNQLLNSEPTETAAQHRYSIRAVIADRSVAT